MRHPPRILLITPARDEERFLPLTIASVTSQTLLPVQWIIVDDGSSDATGRIADEAAAQYDWIRVVHRSRRATREVGAGVVRAFQAGLAIADRDWDFVAKVDADLSFGPRYLEALMEHFAADAALGAASGKVWREAAGRRIEEYLIDDQVSGAFKTYRRIAFEEIGGFHAVPMWDGIDGHEARMNGWLTRSLHDEDLALLHHRLMGSSHRGIITGRRRWGRGQWFMGSHPIYMLASAVFRMREKPRLIGGLAMLAGYLEGWWNDDVRYGSPKFRDHLRTWQMTRLRSLFRKGSIR